jgi:hypothetical protein
VKIGTGGKPEKFCGMKFGNGEPNLKNEQQRPNAYEAIVKKTLRALRKCCFMKRRSYGKMASGRYCRSSLKK